VTTAALIVAAGRGTRAGGAVPKQYALFGGTSVLARTLGVFLDHPAVDQVLVVIGPDDWKLYDTAGIASHAKLLTPVAGGDTRQSSVLDGLRALRRFAPSRVLIHDAVRPFVTDRLVADVLAALDEAPGAIAAVPVADTLKRAGPDNIIAETAGRAGFWRAQTPQGFRFADILAAHEAAAAGGRIDLTDDAAVAEWAGLIVKIVPGSEHNRKLTTAEDIAFASQAIAAAREFRTGQGFDVHRFTAGDHVWLCGVRIPHSHKLEGHSDADVALHALTDALLGAIGEPDIGTLFLNTDLRWKDAPSHVFLAEAARRVTARAGAIVNVDVTILAEAPKVSPHREAMCARIAEILAIERDRVAIKATTTEGLGFTGRREGIAAMATATVVLR